MIRKAAIVAAVAAVAAAAALRLPAAEAIPILEQGVPGAAQDAHAAAAAASAAAVARDSFPRFAEAEPTPVVQGGGAAPAAAKNGYDLPCDLSVERGICLFNGQKVLLPAAGGKGLVGYYTFDDVHPVDQSGYQNHARSVVPTGPGRLGRGSSAFFDGEVGLQVPNSPSLETATGRASASLWFYLRQDYDPNTDLDCSLVALGSPKLQAWSLGFNPKAGLVVLSARGKPLLRSFARLRPGRWYHVAFAAGKSEAVLYVNGVPDARAPLPAGEDTNVYEQPGLYVGKMPWESSTCHVPALVDDLRVYSRALLEYEVSAESFPALGSVDTSFIRRGGADLDYAAALKSCPDGYHLCHKNELAAGGLSAAVAMGWTTADAAIWARTVDEPKDGAEKKVAICCSS